MCPILFALCRVVHSLETKYFSSCFPDYRVKVFSGARTGFVALCLKGGTHSPRLRNCSQVLVFLWCAEYLISYCKVEQLSG